MPENQPDWDKIYKVDLPERFVMHTPIFPVILSNPSASEIVEGMRGSGEWDSVRYVPASTQLPRASRMVAIIAAPRINK